MSSHPTDQPAAAYVFDAYGTIFDFGSAVRRCATAVGHHASTLVDTWRTRQLQYTWLRSLEGRYTDFEQVTADALDYALALVKIRDADLRTQLLALYDTLDPFADSVRALAALDAAGMQCWILSNGTRRMLETAVRAAGLDSVIRGVLSADSVRVYKPDPRVYQLAVDALSLDPKHIAFVSANGWDAFGAAAFGLSAIWCNRAGEPRDRLAGMLAREVRSLDELVQGRA